MNTTFINRFNQTAQDYIDKTAIVCGNHTITYGELAKKSDQMASALIGAGVARRDIVPILLDRSIDTVAAMLGVLKAGAAFCCISADYPADRVRFIEQDTGARLTVNATWMNKAEASHSPLSLPNPDDPAIVVYTSGSTGNPKGVVNSHRALALAVCGNQYSRSADDVILSTASFSFIAVAMDVLTPLSLGATLHIADDTTRRDADRLTEYILQNGITSTFMPPQMARQVLPRVQNQLLTLITGSEKVRGLYSDKTQIFNSYGASETCGPVVAFSIDRMYPDGAPIGVPYCGSKIYIVDNENNLVPTGEQGEICVCGQIADCYLNLPELTAERFIPNPYAEGEFDRVLFKTNDIGRINENGLLEYVQRKDWMIKVRGFRVEPGEVEAAMIRRAPIEQAVVKAFENATGESALFAVYTAKEPIEPKLVTDAIRDFLPDYMIPAFLEQVDALPVNPNGKVDRKNIRPPDIARFKAAYLAPQTKREHQICDAFAHVLGVENVGVLDDFNLLGGDSISAARLMTELPNLGISVSHILSLGTPQKLAALRTETVIPKAEPRSNWPLTFTERQMATEQGMNPSSIAYNINLAFRIKGAVDAERLQCMLNSLVSRHAILRSIYPMQSGEYVHKIEDELTIAIEQACCMADEVAQRIRELNTPFDLSKAPLLRCHLFDTGNNTYVLHFCIHHIIMDGASGDVFMNELFQLYEGKTLPSVEVDYLDYAAWQQTHTDMEMGEAAFREVFADGVPETEMPTLASRPDILPFADVDIVEHIPGTKVEAAARRFGITRYSLLMAALGMTLAKYCGTEDVVLGTAMSGRTMAWQDSMIGMFVNTLPVRVKPVGDLPISEYLLQVAQAIRGTKANQTYPFERLVPLLAPDRNASRSPVFDMIFNYLHEIPLPAMEDLEVTRMPIKGQALAIDLMLEITHEGDHLRAVLSYSRSLYQDEVVQNFMQQFLVILDRLAGCDTQALVMDMADLPTEHCAQIMQDFAGEHRDENLGKTVVSLFRQQAAKTPQNRAIVFQDTMLTYAQLDDVTDRLAARLMQSGTGSGKVVGIMVHRGEMMPVGALGALKAGAAYLPLDPGYPADRLQFMLEDAGVGIVIADRSLFGNAPTFQGEWIDSAIVRDLPPVDRVLPEPKPEDLLILLYTSGTTGNPKGVMLTHGNLANFLQWYSRTHSITETDNIPAYASFGFDACMMDMYPTLAKGACLHIIPEEMRLDLPGLAQYFNNNDISVAFMTTQLGRQFAESMENHSLRALSVGGETLVPIAPPKNFSLYNGYGPTECTILASCFLVDKLYDRVPIGRALDNMALYIVDGRGRLAPVGVAGELCIAGRQVAKGYLNRPDLTGEKFVPNPFSADPDYARMYKTGDVARFLPSGDIDFVGRRDFQVKIRGFRVELTEIEGRIREYPSIQDAAVVAQDDAAGGKRVVAYIVSDDTIDIKALHAFIEEALPAYMVPAATMQIEAIPLNQNGKVNRKALPQISIRAEETLPPQTALQKQLFDIAADILGHESFGITTDLMYAGLSSLSAIKTAARIVEQTGKNISTAELMREKTIEKIAALIEKSDAYSQAAYEKQAAYPLTQNQLGLYFSCVKDPGTLVYNIPFALALPDSTDTDKLAKSLRAVINAHPYLNTHLVMQDSEPMQLRLDDMEVCIPATNCTQAEYELAKERFVRPFNFFKGPLYRIELYRTPDGVYVLCDFHHIIFDGGSMDIFLRDLSSAYAGRELQAELFTSFDASLSEKEAEQGGAYKAAQAYYREKLGDGEGATVLPKDNESAEGGAPRTVIAHIRKSELNAAIRELGITASNLFLAATGMVVGRFASTQQARIASIISGRDGAHLQNNMGMMVKTLPTVLELPPEEAAGDYLQNTQQAMIGLLAHQGYPYMRVSSEYNYHAQLLYAYQGGVVSSHMLDGAPITIHGLGLNKAKFPISINIQDDAEYYITEAEYDEEAFSPETMQNFADCIAHTAVKLAQSQNTKLKDISIQTDAQRQTIDAFNPPPHPIPTQALHKLFERNAKATPAALALYAADGVFTYADLNERANRLAYALIELGAQKGDRIAFLLPRDSRVIVSMLGITKAGCAYIPVDPDYPEDRIGHILSDSGARYILTSGRDIERGRDIDMLLQNEHTENPNVPVRKGDLCYIIYTSGSTGRPKGVMLTHGNIVNYVTNHPQNRHVHALVEHGCTMVSVTTVSFDMFLKEAFTTLMNGLTLVLADDEQSKNPDRLAELFAKTGATAFNATPSRMMQYIELPAMQQAIAGCKVVMAGGEAFPPSLYAKLRSFTKAELINTYGPTETTVSCNGKLLDGGQVTVGSPLLNVTEHVMDLDGNPLPTGFVGELWIGGAGVACGYYGNEAMTDERFIQRDSIRYYRSGDLAKWTQNGEIVILGRNDGQIKLRGLRIELGEIENALTALEHIKRGVVLVKTLHGQEHLCAYYTAEKELSAETLRNALSRSLAKYMVPTAYLQLDSLPMTPNGKVDGKALPDALLMKKEDYVPPHGPDEEAYCAIFQNILHMDRVGATDNFFDLGGTSLLVTQVTIDAAKQGYTLSYGDVFACPTPRELAALAQAPAEKQVQSGLVEYDYSSIHALLQENTLDSLRAGELRDVGNICLTGATGFLGVHVLREFLRSEKGTAYCVVRGGKTPAEMRLKSMLVYYFSDSFDNLFGSRIVVIDGDITDDPVYERLQAFPVDTYINCAANVKHFSAGTDIEDINVGGVQKGIAFCQKKQCRFVQISTASVAGMSIDGNPPEHTKMDESMLYIGQDISNKYVGSKFLAERITLEAALGGLDAKILRVGNLMARAEDGEFQANFNTNNFLGRLKAYYIIGRIPYADMGVSTEFAPIDFTAAAVLRLARTPAACRVFHPYNDHTIFMSDIIQTLQESGVTIQACEAEEYERAYGEALMDSEKAKHLNSLIAYSEHGKRVVPLRTTNHYTSQVLLRQGFRWPITTEKYLSNFFEMMKGLGFFEPRGEI